MGKKTEKEYIPYGPEWEKEMMNFSKRELIKLLTKVLIILNPTNDGKQTR
jgi:hypothetical protein